MKSVTEFEKFKITQGLAAKTALAGEGKSPEEISAGIGEKFKLEGDKLKFFVNALEVAGPHLENLKRVLVVSLSEGETAPHRATQVEEHHYIPELLVTIRPPVEKADGKKGGGKGGGRGGKGGSPKSSPWGLTPEEKAAKKGGGKPK